MFKYNCLNPIAKVGLEMLNDNYKPVDEFAEADAVLVRSAKMHDLEMPKQLLAIARAGAGVNNIPCDACAEKGIVVFNTPGANANGVKELVIAGMLLAARDIVGGIKWVQENAKDPEVGTKAEKAKKEFAGTELMGKKLGIIGLGAIGVKVANAAANLGMKVFGYDPFISVDAAWNLSSEIEHVKDVNEIYEKCDFITIHVPLMDETKKMLNAEAFKKMKDGVIILNFARDLLVNEVDMLNAIEAGKVRKYVTDFANADVAGKKNVIVIPHLGASTEESEDNCAKMAVKEVMDFLENGNITNSVNYPNCDMGKATTAGRIALYHKNVKGMLGKFTAVMADADINIVNMTNKSKGDIAYSLFDIETAATDEVVAKLEAIDEVIRVRVVK